MNEKRIARIAWNNNGWVMPSGRGGKSKNKDSHENKYGYGHEEWLLDTGKIIDGYHYGFLEPIRKHQEAYTGKTYDVWIYSLNSFNKKRYFIGEINNLEVINAENAEAIKEIYIEKGWFDEMKLQIINCAANNDGFSDWKGVDLFNVRFRISDINIKGDYEELPKENKLYKFSRYTFTHFDKSLIMETSHRDFAFKSRTKSLEASSDFTLEKNSYELEPKSIEVTYLHKAISKRLLDVLSEEYGFENLSDELLAGYGNNKIDMVVKDGKDFIFYEIKTYNSSRSSIREAIGQLLEYSCWISSSYAYKLVIVSQKLADLEDAKMYIMHLRKKFNLPIFFKMYDVELDIFCDEI